MTLHIIKSKNYSFIQQLHDQILLLCFIKLSKKLFLCSTVNVNKIKFNLPMVHLARTHYSYLPTFSSQIHSILLCSIKLTGKKLVVLTVWYTRVDHFKQGFNPEFPNILSQHHILQIQHHNINHIGAKGSRKHNHLNQTNHNYKWS